MKNFYEFYEMLKNEALERDLFDPHPDVSEPEGGTTHSLYRLKSKEGGDYWSKAAASDLQTVNEYLAWKLYRLFGIKVAEKAHLVVDNNGGLRLVASQVSGKQMPLNYGSRPAQLLAGTDIQRGFFVDAFLGHWDVIGNEPRSNLFIDDENRVTRIDLGGMGFRAMGGRKNSAMWGGKVGELQTMGGIGGSPMAGHSSAVFGSLKDNPEQLQQAAVTFQRVKWDEIEHVVNEVESEIQQIAKEHGIPSLADEASQYLNEVKSVLKSRFADLHQKLKGLGLE